MRFLIVSQYFWPETFIINDLVLLLEQNGHQVTVATGKPNYPSGTISPGYDSNAVQEEIFGGSVRVVRVPIRARGNGGAWNLFRNYLSFVTSATCHLPRRIRDETYDAIFVFAVSPITAAIPAIVLKVLKRAHLAIWIQDLWPESLSATGLIQNRFALRIVGFLVRWIYASADTLFIQSEAFRHSVQQRAARNKIVLFSNFAPLDPVGETPLMPQTLDLLGEGFNVIFAGNLGRAQALGTIVEAAEIIRGKAPKVQFVIAGDGTDADGLQKRIHDLQLPNVHLIGLLPPSQMPALFGKADLLLVTLAPASAFEKTIPSKIQAYMKAGKPLVGALNGEGARVIREAQAGLTVPALDAKGLADTILTMAQMSPNTLAKFGQNARAYFVDNFEASHSVQKLVSILQSRVPGSEVG